MKNIAVIVLLLSSTNAFSQMINRFYKLDEKIREGSSEVVNVKEILNIEENIQLEEVDRLSHQDDLGFTHRTFRQSINGIDIEFSDIKAHYKGNNLFLLNGDFVRSIVPIEPSVSQEEAFKSAINTFKEQNFIWDQNEHSNNYPSVSREKPLGQLVYLYRNEINENLTEPILAFKFDIFNISPIQHEWVYVSAENGEVILRLDRVCSINGTAETRYSGSKTISTKNVSGDFRLIEDGTSRCEIETTVDNSFLLDNDNYWSASEYDNAAIEQAALDIHWGAEMFFDYFQQKFNRNSIDDLGHILSANYSTSSSDQALWLGFQAAFYKGDKRFETTASLDIVAHEFAHGLCDRTCDLITEDESGAINEGLSDVWAACVEFFAAPNKDHWLIGEEIDLLRPSLRNMEDPNYEVDPDTYNGLYWCDYNNSSLDCTIKDKGGVHINSGVFNHWFYLLTDGGSDVNDNSDNFSVNGIGIADAARIVYRAEVDYFTNTTDFHQARGLTVQAAKDLFGDCSSEVKSVINAWYAVGVGKSLEQANSFLITTDVLSFDTKYEYGYTLIEANNTIHPDANVRYESSKQIVLKPGFQAKAGSDFFASILPCSTSTGGGISSKNGNGIKSSNEETGIISKNISCYPNPFSSRLIINLNDLYLKGSFYQIISVSGQIILEEEIKQAKFELFLPELQSGMYFLKVLSSENQVYKKLIKE